jgi:esterase/lipase superfamily enzyme
MGSHLVMEALRQIEITTPGWSQANLNGVILMSPDLDVDVFRTQMNRIEQVPQPFIVFVSRKDSILNLSRRLRGTHSRARLGSIGSIDQVSDLPIHVIDTTAFSDTAGSQHFVTATSPALIALLNSARETAEAFGNTNVSPASVLPGRVKLGESATEIELLRFSAAETN